MTEPELVQVLSGRFAVDEGLLQNVSSPDFPTKLFEILDKTLAYDLLMDIFNRSIIVGTGLCDAEKAIVREVRSWNGPETPEHLLRVTYMFLDSDVRSKADQWQL